MQSPRRWKRFELQVAEKAGKKCLNTLETAWITRWETWGICRTTLDLFEPYLSIDHHSSLISSNFTLSIDRLTRGRGFLMARPIGRKLSTFTRRIKFQYEQEGNNTIYQPIYIRCRIVFYLISSSKGTPDRIRMRVTTFRMRTPTESHGPIIQSTPPHSLYIYIVFKSYKDAFDPLHGSTIFPSQGLQSYVAYVATWQRKRSRTSSRGLYSSRLFPGDMNKCHLKLAERSKREACISFGRN